MPSSTSSSEPRGGAAPEPQPPPPPVRAVPQVRWGVAALVAVLLFLAGLAAWEGYWRSQGAPTAYRNSEGLWALQRRRINQGEGNATVLVGSSRTLSNIPLHVWERLDGRRPIQLALEGTSPVTPLEGLADDPDFTGRVIVGVTPVLFFSGFSYRQDVLDYYPRESPSQRFGQWLSMTFLEPWLAFYSDPDYALFVVLKRQSWPLRPGVHVERDVRRLFEIEADRNMWLWEKLETDLAYQKLAQDIWRDGFRMPPGMTLEKALEIREQQLQRAEAAVAKLKQRGVEVIFVLHPVDGEFAGFELKVNPRAETWEPLLARTGARGIHFQDHPELQGYWLPEWSHIARADAQRYAEALYRILQRTDAAPEDGPKEQTP